ARGKYMDLSQYFEYQTATPISNEVINAIYNSLKENWGDPGGKNIVGLKTKEALENAKKSVGKMINCDPEELMFMSSIKEANGYILNKVLKLWNAYIQEKGIRDEIPHFIISEVEHPSVIEKALSMEAEKTISLSLIHVQQDGTIDVEAAEDHMNTYRNTALVSLMHANNETGAINDIKRLSSIVKKFNTNSRSSSNNFKVLVHTDSSYIIGKGHVDVQNIGVDYMTFSGRLVNSGVVFVKGLSEKISLNPLLYGSVDTMEGGSMIENVPMIVGLGVASDLIMRNIYRDMDHYDTLTKYFMRVIRLRNPYKRSFDIGFNGDFSSSQKVIPNTVNFSLKVLDSSSIPMIKQLLEADLFTKLLEKGFSLGKRSEFYSGPSPILSAMGVEGVMLKTALRFSVGRETTMSDVDNFIDAYWDLINELGFNEKAYSYINLFGVKLFKGMF
ncbi:hypothetical protein BB560_004410, partial [Smittium megazygosporum]